MTTTKANLAKAARLRKAGAAQDALNKADHKALAAAEARNAAVMAAREAGASYAQIQDATSLSITRITQILRRARNATTTEE